MRYGFMILLIHFMTQAAIGQKQHSADAVMKEAYNKAARSDKKVFLIFHASWCVWCKKMEASMKDSTCKSSFEKNFVTVFLDVDETDDKKSLENPGADALRNKYFGKDQGIPFWLIFDKDGKLLADSKIRKEGEGPAQGSNVGCPAAEDEVNYFIGVLKKTTPLTEYQLDLIQKRFRQNEN
jgi:thiol-disulfide isomerase/thioredoxin